MIRLLLRGDDFGGSLSANQAIAETCEHGFLRNVSVMAPGSYLEQGALLLADCKEICFGMHITMNAEWDRVKWKPVLPCEQVPSLIDEQGYFLSHPSLMGNVNLEEAIAETLAQYDRLREVGFPISYVDEHMFFSYSVKGYAEWLDNWCRQEDLVNFHRYFQPLPRAAEAAAVELADPNDLAQIYLSRHMQDIQAAPEGLYTVILHPGLDSVEMRQFGNAELDGADIAAERAAERRMLLDPRLESFYSQYGVISVRYDELEERS
ncbi:ChbG/HpnK family deacetylase [Paenibacillus glycanilyticus]|uniref:ChbG/HpnK family deacetylase n=1 Tax=Paenibacillus glycanilyticus TaxID=126569 RepID=UPI000FD8B5AE|nr:ChbG/HpnK family deacetylase [Paenibacillus glycanilyticus]